MKAAFAGLALLAAAKVISKVNYVPTKGMWCVFDWDEAESGDTSDPELDEEFTFKPLACFRSVQEAYDVADVDVPTNQGSNSRGHKRKVLCESTFSLIDAARAWDLYPTAPVNPDTWDKNQAKLFLPKKRKGKYVVAEVDRCVNRTLPKVNNDPWLYGPDAWEDFHAGKRPDMEPEPLAGLRRMRT